MISTAGALLAALEPLPHSARLRLTAVTAHRLAADGLLRPLLGELDALGPYERRLGALAAFAAGDLEHLAARLGDLDPVVRRYALRAVRRLPAHGPEAGDPAADSALDKAVEAALTAAYDDAPAVVRADLARLLRDGRRSALAERLVGRVRTEYGERDAALLLPGCSPEFTARLLPELAGALRPEDWSTLALRHPGAVLDQAERQLAGLTGRSRDAWWRRYAAGPAAALPAAPERVLELLETYGPEHLPGPVHDRLGDLVAVDAERVVRWLADPDRRRARWERTAGPALIRRLVAADPPSLPRLGLRWFHRDAFGTLLRTVAPERRGAFLDAVVAAAGPQDYNVRVHPDVLAPLPPAERHARARALLDDAQDSWDRWRLLTLLPPDEARPELTAALASPDAEQRGGVWDMLVLNAAHSRDPQQVGDVLARAAGRLAHEWDSVRRDLLSALAGVPTPLLGTALEGADGSASLERLCRDALVARDCSPMTRDAIRTLATALLSDRTTTTALPLGARILETLTAHTGAVELDGLDAALDDEGVRAVSDALGPWLDRSAARGDVAPLLALVASCGGRAYGVPGLRDRLEKALATCPDPVFGEVAAAWLADPATRGGRVAELLAREPSAAFLPPVLAVLAAERTDLLDAVLAETVPPGERFPAAGVARPLPAFRHADRWLPRQQEAAVRLAAAFVADPDRGTDERAAVLRAVAPVPEHGRALLRRYASAGPDAPGPERALAAAALDAAAHTDDPASALDALLDHAGDSEAAAAWSAAGRAAAHARPSRVAALLRDVLTRETGVKVTVRKAAVRLAARHLPQGSAVTLLSDVARAPGVHPDVHATVVGLAATLLPAPEMWALLESAVADDGPEAARSALLDANPADVAPAHRARFGELMARSARGTSQATATYLFLSGLADWARYAPEAGTALADLYTDLGRTEQLWTVRGGLQDLARSDLPHPVGGVAPGSLLHGVVDRLLAYVAAGEPEGGGRDGDLPALRRLHSLLESPRQDPGRCAELARQIADEPLATATRTALLVRAIDLTAPAPEILGAVRDLLAVVSARPVLAARTAEDLEEAHQHGTPLADPGAALAAVRALGDDGGLVPGVLAVGLANAVGSRQGWPDPCRTALLALRRHPDPDVRDLAYATDLSGRH
ncbi:MULTISPECIES: hypothetical protein [Streptomyces]|uniref:PBS lyase n=2 Tax=Streptomyces TaxID=1883 RepID=A0ABU4KFB7_9ACTN|nr:hypothetical protein [Streptomyces roseolus]MDX2296489.1 hypothetical protein [Streptomyces roseolus]